MAYSFHSTVPFGEVYTGLTGTVGYQLYNADGTTSGSRVTAGISELGITGFYHVLLSLADGWTGSIQWDTGGADPVYGIEDIRAVMTDAASRTASKNTASEIRTAVGLATANLDTQLGAKATSTQLAAVQTHGDSTWATADVSGAATAEALAAAKTVIDTIATDTGETIPAAIAGIGGGGGTGTGARTVAIIVNDGTTALESARVRFTKGAETYVSSTNVSGQVSFSLDDGTWSVAITLAGYSFTPTTLVVNSDETQTYSMMLATVTSSETNKVTGYWYTLDEEGEVEASVDIELRIVSSSLVGTAHDAAIRTEISDVNGLVQFTNLVKGAKYEARRGTAMRWTQFSVATTATTPYALPDIWGSEA